MTDFVLEYPSHATASANDVYRKPSIGTLTARESMHYAAIVASAMATATAFSGFQSNVQISQTPGTIQKINQSYLSPAKQSVRPPIQLTQEEHEVFRLAILDSAEIVSRGRFVEL